LWTAGGRDGGSRIRRNAEAGAAAEECFSRAIEIAQSQQAKWFELRAALSLSRLRREQGKDPRVSVVLLPVYNWFTEGFDTPDLLAAKQFLQSAE
jgi:predicted ATPase